MDDLTEKPKELAEEAERGRNERTPALAISGVAIAVGALFAVVVAVAIAAYLIA